MNHTKEPWIIVPGGRLDPEVIITTQHRLDGRKAEICGMDVEFTGHHGDEQKANTRRIVACVNACAGIPTDTLETIPSWSSAGVKTLADVVKQRDELLAALKKMLDIYHYAADEMTHGQRHESRLAVITANAAIAKAEQP